MWNKPEDSTKEPPTDPRYYTVYTGICQQCGQRVHCYDNGVIKYSHFNPSSGIPCDHRKAGDETVYKAEVPRTPEVAGIHPDAENIARTLESLARLIRRGY
jgi:hypothetical protein